MALVALVGRPNVGKSALFNRITQTRRAIVEDVAGVTRDRLYESTDWNGVEFMIVDTGGIWVDEEASLLTMTRRQTEIAIREADVIVFVVDGQSGPTASDDVVVNMLRRAHKPVVVAVNKAESHRVVANDFFAFGLGDPVLISALHGEGTGDLLDRVVDSLPKVDSLDEAEDETPIRIALAGRPNVGKSSLVNALVGEERVLVTPIAGTTRDVVDTEIEVDGRRFVLLDTAGLRRPNRIDDDLEQKTVGRTLEAIRNADVVLLLVAGDEPLAAQDQRIAGQVAKAKKATVVLINKADLIKGSTVERVASAKEELKFMPWASVASISAQTGWRLDTIWDMVNQAYEAYTQRLTTHRLNQLLQEATHLNPPPTDKGHALKLYYATQVAIRPPHFVFFVNDPELVHFSYERYLENRLRERFNFAGSPITLSFRQRRRRERTSDSKP
ncbi:MAG: ribosome biogenesis GTPase Der [Firmicutes bacterium]|nr:ribosome biogenesis GTPase Der [Bacillota bacterium]MCL5064740.1 ribosome biogenesis GTPase Der [Bacillota bacterium]